MRVTKNVREYIEEQVYAKAMQSVADLKNKADDAKKRFNDDLDRLREECNVLLKNTISKHNLVDRYGYEPYVSFGRHLDDHLPEVIAYNDALRDLRTKQSAAVMEIVVEMELGGSKADLMDKLNNLTF